MWSEGVEVEEGVTWVWGGLGWQRKDKGGCHSAPQPLPSQSPALQAHSLIMPVESGSSTCCSVAKSCVTLWPHGLQRSRLPCPSLSPGVCSNSCPLSQWRYLYNTYVYMGLPWPLGWSSLPTMLQTWFRSLGWEEPLKKAMATHSSSCLENSMDRGAWWSTIYGVTKSQTRLSDFILHISII